MCRRPTYAKARAINCTEASASELPSSVVNFIRHSLASNTQRAYLSDLRHFEAWGGRIPASPSMLAIYLAECAGQLKISTLMRRIVGIGKAHEARGFPNPVRSELVRATLQGIRRTHGSARREARPLMKEELGAIVDGLGTGVRDRRDRALLLIGFAGGFRRLELVGLDHSDIQIVR